MSINVVDSFAGVLKIFIFLYIFTSSVEMCPVLVEYVFKYFAKYSIVVHFIHVFLYIFELFKCFKNFNSHFKCVFKHNTSIISVIHNVFAFSFEYYFHINFSYEIYAICWIYIYDCNEQ